MSGTDSERGVPARRERVVWTGHHACSVSVNHYTALGSDGQGPHGFSFVFWILFDFSDLFTDLARASLGLLGASVELVVRPSTYGAHNRTAAL